MTKPYAIGIDLGGTNLRAALVSRDFEVVKKLKEPSSGLAAGGDVIRLMKAAIDELMSPEVEGIGIGVAGVLERGESRITISPNIPPLNGYSFNDLAYPVPVYVENDANSAALGEARAGAGRNFKNFVLMTLGTGIGGGIIYGGELLKVAAEVGHMSIAADGKKCFCGNNGCLEIFASARAIIAAVVEALEGGAESILRECCQGKIYRITPEDVYKAAFGEGDILSREVLKEAGRYLGVGIANIINIMSPEAVILAGGLVGSWNIYVDEAIKEASKRSFKSLFQGVSIIPASLGDEAGAVGAASLVFNEGK
ncbi:MAG: ROK family protein [Nitrospiraceae bacterium]|nr:ROK family protein [Nitrospiraceae bacterium]